MSIAVRSEAESYLERMRTIRSAWSGAERRRRVGLGRRLRQVFFQRFTVDPVPSDIWAVGSITSEDLVRFARCD
jgi:hypothetical protein